MAAKPQQGIRNVIQILLFVLEDAGIPRMPSESFRKAKFNQPEVIQSFWTTLHHMIDVSKSLEYSRITSSMCKTSMKHSSLFIRKQFFNLGYNRMNFFSQSTGSRELLLAFAWLLHKSNLVNRLLQYHLQTANTVSIPLKTGQGFLIDEAEKDITNFKEELELIQRESSYYKDMEQLEVALKKLAWLKGKTECRLKSALSSQHSYQKLADRIHKFTWGQSHNEHLSVYDVFLLRHPEQLSNHLLELEKHLLALQRLIEWQSSEPLFWQWMESVLDLEERESRLTEAVSSDEASEEAAEKPLSREELEMKVKELEREVLLLVEKNRPHIDKINHSWLFKSRSVRTEDIKAELVKIHAQMGDSEKTAAIKPHSDSLSFVEELKAIDLPVRLPVCDKSTTRHGITVSPEQDRACSERLQALNDKLRQVQSELEHSRVDVMVARNAVARQLEMIEKTLPPNVCKLAT